LTTIAPRACNTMVDNLLRLVLWSISLSVIALVLWWRSRRTDRVVLVHQETELTKKILEGCPNIHVYKNMPIWGLSGNLQSIYASQIRKGPTPKMERHFVLNAQGVEIAVDWIEGPPDINDATPIILIVPGIAGHSSNDYIKNFVHFCKLSGFRTVVFNWPGCDNKLTKPYLQTTGDSKDLKLAVEHIHTHCPRALMMCVGYSLGGNLLLRYLGEDGHNTPFKSAIVLSTGYDVVEGAKKLTSNFYRKALVGKWRGVLLKNKDVFEGSEIDIERVLKAETPAELDTTFSVPLLKMESLEHYYRSSSAVHFMKHIAIPTLLLNARDDPIIHHSLIDIAIKSMQSNQNLIVGFTKYGGHQGWIQGGFWFSDNITWMDTICLEFMQSTVHLTRAQPELFTREEHKRIIIEK
jgi:predicted alpha/beta-fold hydrolase